MDDTPTKRAQSKAERERREALAQTIVAEHLDGLSLSAARNVLSLAVGIASKSSVVRVEPLDEETQRSPASSGK